MSETGKGTRSGRRRPITIQTIDIPDEYRQGLVDIVEAVNMTNEIFASISNGMRRIWWTFGIGMALLAAGVVALAVAHFV